MPLTVVGSIAIDTVETPEQKVTNVLGGAATYFSYAAKFFTPVRLVAVVGEDFPPEHRRLLEDRDIDLSGLEVRQGGETFRWSGKYEPNMNDRQTMEVHLNVLGDFRPVLSDQHRASPYLFLANMAPQTQLSVLEQMENPKLTVADTMDLWIEIQHDELMQLLKRIDGLVLNDQEAKLLTNTENLVEAGHKVRELGPKFVVLKKGEHGAIFFGEHDVYALPAYPTVDVVDPTGAGDSFAGGLMGCIAASGDSSPQGLKEAIAYGMVTASYTVEGFSLSRLAEIEHPDIVDRFGAFQKMVSF